MALQSSASTNNQGNTRAHLPSIRGLGLLSKEIETTLPPMLTGNSSDNRKTVLNGVTVNIYHRTGQGPGSELPSLMDEGIHPDNPRDMRLAYPGGSINGTQNDGDGEQSTSEPEMIYYSSSGQLDRDMLHRMDATDSGRYAHSSGRYTVSKRDMSIPALLQPVHNDSTPHNAVSNASMRHLPIPIYPGSSSSSLPSSARDSSIAQVVVAVQTSTGIQLPVPRTIQARFVTMDNQSEGVFDCVLGRKRKRMMIDNDSKRDKHLEDAWDRISLEKLEKNPFYQEGDEDMTWKSFKREIHRRYIKSISRQSARLANK